MRWLLILVSSGWWYGWAEAVIVVAVFVEGDLVAILDEGAVRCVDLGRRRTRGRIGIIIGCALPLGKMRGQLWAYGGHFEGVSSRRP